MILDGQYRLASPVSPLGERRELRFVSMTDTDGWIGAQLALVRGTPEEPWAPVLLRTFVGGRVLLAALVDHAGSVREWLEVWVQTSPGMTSSPRGNDHLLNNAALDARWDALATTLLQTDRAAVLVTGFEHCAPPPLWIDLEQSRRWPTAQSTGGNIELCTDEAALATAGLPSYAGSLERYLWRKGNPSEGFARVTGGGLSSQAAPAWIAPANLLLSVNPQAGRILVRRHAPFDLDSYADFLSGRGLGRTNTNSPFVFLDPANEPPLDACDQLQQSGAFFIPTTRGLAGRFLETFHLKLLLFTQVVRAVQANTEALQMPMLNLCASSFRVDFASPASELPILWTARATLVDASAARVIPLPTTEKRRFQRHTEPTSLIYSAAQGAPPARGEGTLRIRKIATESERFVLQATLSTDEFISVRDSDLVYLELPVPGEAPVPVYGQLDTGGALNVNERRFHSFPSVWSPEVHGVLSRMEGHAFRQVRFETLPLLGARQDMYSLGVIAARILLTHSRHTLAESIDEVLSLARTMARVDGTTAAQRAQQLALSDARWHTALGPQHHGHGCATPDEGYRWLPMELWWDAVATLARFFPGAGVFSYAPDFNDPTDLPLQKTYDEPLRDLERLIQHSRSLLLSDWLANREVARVIQRVR